MITCNVVGCHPNPRLFMKGVVGSVVGEVVSSLDSRCVLKVGKVSIFERVGSSSLQSGTVPSQKGEYENAGAMYHGGSTVIPQGSDANANYGSPPPVLQKEYEYAPGPTPCRWRFKGDSERVPNHSQVQPAKETPHRAQAEGLPVGERA